MQFANNARVKKAAHLALMSNQLRAAQNYLVKRAQVKSFNEEIQCLEMGQEIHKKSKIESLDPRMEDGFLVVSVPECRLQPGMVFRNTGVDFFGPMLVKERSSEH